MSDERTNQDFQIVAVDDYFGLLNAARDAMPKTRQGMIELAERCETELTYLYAIRNGQVARPKMVTLEKVMRCFDQPMKFALVRPNDASATGSVAA